MTEEEFQEHPIINWDGIIWVNRPLYLWIVQVILAMISFTEAILLAYLGYKVSVAYNNILSNLIRITLDVIANSVLPKYFTSFIS